MHYTECILTNISFTELCYICRLSTVGVNLWFTWSINDFISQNLYHALVSVQVFGNLTAWVYWRPIGPYWFHDGHTWGTTY